MATKVMVFLPSELLAEVDRLAEEEQCSRSELLGEAMRLYIEVRRGELNNERDNERRGPGGDPRVRQAVAVQDALAQLAPGNGEDSTSDIRRWREIR